MMIKTPIIETNALANIGAEEEQILRAICAIYPQENQIFDAITVACILPKPPALVTISKHLKHLVSLGMLVRVASAYHVNRKNRTVMQIINGEV